MASAGIQFAISVAIIVAAAIWLARCADVIAERTGLGRLLVGSLFLAAATSLPELSVDISAIRMGLVDVAVGDLLGSCLFNLLILALADLFHRSRGRLLSPQAAAHSLAGTLTIALAATAGMGIAFEPQLDEIAWLPLGPTMLAIFVTYALGLRLIFHDQRIAAPDNSRPASESAGGMSLRAALVGYLVAAAMVFAAAPFLSSAAGQIAELSGLGGTFIGTTLVALSTSLPELVATIAAMRMGAFDLAAGNIFGSNAFNILLLVPLDAVHPGWLLASISPLHMVTCFAVILVTSIVILGQLYRVEKRILLVEPDAALVITLVLGALLMIYIAS